MASSAWTLASSWLSAAASIPAAHAGWMKARAERRGTARNRAFMAVLRNVVIVSAGCSGSSICKPPAKGNYDSVWPGMAEKGAADVVKDGDRPVLRCRQMWPVPSGLQLDERQRVVRVQWNDQLLLHRVVAHRRRAR